ncbi:hypothetical protein GTV32_10630 [Gordonia sp. SID5947]|uniref:hypothetical protein n=1 Tax=Gordonia sp. SID5947 TaxID=2690315 RepID=UPI00136A95F7|nr:hypothetical protein [Gordonia sp. SID5947]MYR06734.1 hypothetical protein [Gordonia sp. SID5947]
MAGWDISVHVLEDGPILPLEILGARVFDLRYSLDHPTDDPWPQSLAISASVLDVHERLRMSAVAAVETGRVDLRTWAAAPSDVLELSASSTRYHLSVAAQAFKRRALEVSGLPVSVAHAVEDFEVASAPSTGHHAESLSARLAAR